MLDIFHQTLQAAGGIKEDELVAFIQQRAQYGNNKKLEDRIRVQEMELETGRAMNEEYKSALQFAKEAAIDASTQANKVALAATKAYFFVENTGEVLVAANLIKEGLQAAKDFASIKFRKFVRVVTDYQDKMESTLIEMPSSVDR